MSSKLKRVSPMDPLLPLQTGQVLHATTIPRLASPRVLVNGRVVVVGGGSTGISLLDELLLDESYAFTNVTLISPQGLTSEVRSGFADTLYTLSRHGLARGAVGSVSGTLALTTAGSKLAVGANTSDAPPSHAPASLRSQAPTLSTSSLGTATGPIPATSRAWV